MKSNNFSFAAVALVVGLFLGYAVHTSAPVQAPVSQDGNLGAVSSQSVYTIPNFTAGYQANGITLNSASGKITAQSKLNQAAWKNTTGQTQYVTLAEFSTDGTASSTFKAYVGTSTAATYSSDFVAPYASLINGFPLATSSLATTTTNYDKPLANRVIQVPNNTYVVFQLQGVDKGCASQGGVCETATSSNRGFNIFWRLFYHD